jgi:ArsR family transcriptional regulator, arsenate/arsenite/antimonite-responsive transcriptional repressor
MWLGISPRQIPVISPLAAEAGTAIFSSFDEQRHRRTMDPRTSRCLTLDEAPEIPGGAAADEALADLAKALGHPVRAGIVRFLARQESCMYGDLADQLPLAKSTVSEHLRILREAGLVRGDVDGPRVCYCIDPEGLRRLRSLVGEL